MVYEACVLYGYARWNPGYINHRMGLYDFTLAHLKTSFLAYFDPYFEHANASKTGSEDAVDL